MSPESNASTARPDPTVTDPDKYKVLLENDRVRVLEYRDMPGQSTQPHYHPDFVLYAVKSCKRKFTLPELGKTATREINAGTVVWSDAHIHIGENVGNTDTHVLIIELKEPGTPS